ncbi:hypothetical protein LCGC14_1040780 [marine sediment metagenome]|uniref:Uncharacterized protein n=1 Tax=marine sediment metagenome TaxID=412755 RepID=A0A0F9QXZ6_9ZZZZ
MDDGLTASEALYGFAAWLTTRKATVSFGGDHDCAVAADLVAEFCKTNNLEEPRDDWTKNLTHPN